MGFEGGCLCGAVRFESKVDASVEGECYCVDCRKTSGTDHCSHLMVPEEAFGIEGEVRFFDKPADSGNMVSRGFCPTCGSAVYSTNSGVPGMVFPRASALDDPEVFSAQMVVYASRAPSWARLPEDVPIFQLMPSGD